MQIGNMGFNRGGVLGNDTSGVSWMGVPQPTFSQQQQNDIMMQDLAGMTLKNIHAKAYSGETRETSSGGLSGIVPNSPHMSPNVSVAPHPVGLHSDVGRYAEERKPQPIGIERARKSYHNQQMDPSWSVMDNQAKWTGNSLEYGMRQPPMYSEEPSMDFAQVTKLN